MHLSMKIRGTRGAPGGLGGKVSVALVNLPSLTTALTKGGKNRHMADLALADGPAWARSVRVLISEKSSLTASVETGTQEPVERRREFSWDDETRAYSMVGEGCPHGPI